jgi:GT2 family glycosyltransferase
MKIAVLLTCHNRKNKTINCLNALHAADLPLEYCMDVFLVDDGSTDNTSQAVKESFPHVTIIKGDGKLYWNQGMLLAWKTAAKTKKYDFYLWLNDDTNIYKNALIELTESSNKFYHKKNIIGTTIDPNTKNISYGGRLNDRSLIIPNGKIQKCDLFNGNIVLIPKAVFSSIGFNNKQFRHALGDFDYGLRSAKNGINSFICPNINGECEEHHEFNICFNPNEKLIKRVLNLYKPLGNNPIEFFKFDLLHRTIFTAIFHFFTIHLRVLFPTLWIK